MVALVNEGLVMKALDYAIENEVTGMKVQALQEAIDQLKLKGDDRRANMIARRVQELRRFDEIRQKQNAQYKPLLVE